MDGNEETVHEFVENTRKDFKKLPAEEVSFPRSVNGILEYANAKTIYRKSTPMHVRASLLFNHYIKKNT